MVSQLRQGGRYAAKHLIATDSGENHAIVPDCHGLRELPLAPDCIAIDPRRAWTYGHVWIHWLKGAFFRRDVQMGARFTALSLHNSEVTAFIPIRFRVIEI